MPQLVSGQPRIVLPAILCVAIWFDSRYTSFSYYQPLFEHYLANGEETIKELWVNQQLLLEEIEVVPFYLEARVEEASTSWWSSVVEAYFIKWAPALISQLLPKLEEDKPAKPNPQATPQNLKKKRKRKDVGTSSWLKQLAKTSRITSHFVFS